MSEQPIEQVLSIQAKTPGQRLDHCIVEAVPDLSRSEIQRLIKAGQILVNGAASKPAYRLEQGDSIEINLPDPPSAIIEPEDIPLNVIYEDGELVVIDKPAGMVVHPAFGNRSGTLVNAALARWPEMREVGGEDRVGIVHRLDKDTSGLLVMAKSTAALEALQAQFKARTVYKRYLALVEGVPGNSNGLIEAPIGRDPRQRKRMTVTRDGRPAKTRYDLIEDLGTNALLSLVLHTGRTHQIRVHLAWLGHPIVGDAVYGFRKQRIKMKRLFLHAAELHIDSPGTGERLEFQSPLPDSLENILDKLHQNLGTAWDQP
ncbi:MAG: RluA family pseudouridine synthase [Anaerolineae bacterium]|nr:RluA family pseudouridine synthase [Anaerolineae bacterium]